MDLFRITLRALPFTEPSHFSSEVIRRMFPIKQCLFLVLLQTSVGVRAVLQGYTGGYQGAEPQRQLRGSVQDRGLHVGWTGLGTQERELYMSNIYYIHFSLSENINCYDSSMSLFR